jgi:hypothetical protein
MSPRITLSAALLAAAFPAGAQPPASGSPPPAQAPAAPPAQPSQAEIGAIQQAGQAFGTCISAGIQNVPASATPEAGAAGVLSGCASQRQTLVQAVEAMLANMPEAQRTEGHAQMEAQLGEVPGHIAEGIRQQRAGAAAAATAPPAPPAPPTAPATPPH